MGDSIKDSRFSHIANDPRFKTIPRSQRQVKIDKRFQSMFKDKRFKIKYTVDKRGRPISRTSNEDLERYYALSSGSSDSEGEGSPSSTPRSVKPLKESKSKLKLQEPESAESEDEEDEDKVSADEADDDIPIRSDDEEVTDNVKSKLKDMSVDYARGEGAILSDSSSSEEESSEDEAEGLPEHEWGELDKDAERTEEVTSRLAVCNMDWDRIRAVDLMVLLNSFTPPGGLVRRVTIYPSEFGLERMRKEEEEGPTELVRQSSKTKDVAADRIKDNFEENSQDSDGSEEDDSGNEMSGNENEEGSSYHMEKLRQYQLNRLKYFYAIVECDSTNTANHIYSECDGMEYESSATRLDLRFVPDETVFEQEPREICSEMPDASKYRPRNFTTTALQQAKVELTWDETDPNRTEIANRLLAGDSVDDNDLQAYLACSSGDEEEEEVVSCHEGKKGSNLGRTGKLKENPKAESSSEEEESDDEDPIAKYRSLLHGIEEEEKGKKNKDVHMEISWGLGLKEKAEEAVKKRIASSKELTPFQQMMEKRKQKLQEKRKQKSLKKMQRSGSEEDENLVSDDDIPSDIDMNDPYFAEEFKDFKSKSKKSKKKNGTSESQDDQQQKAELELLLLDKDEPNHFNFKKIQEEEGGMQSKRKKKAKQRKEKQEKLDKTAEDNFQMDVNDTRFSALFSSHHFNIDPTDPHFRKTNAMDALISAKQKRLADADDKVVDRSRSSPPIKKPKADAELSRLIKSVKNKAQKMKR